MDFFNVEGVLLVTDHDVQESVTQASKTPIYAAFSDSAIHDFEYRREELTQMQWKLVRDQFTHLSGQIAALGHQVHEVRERVKGSEAAQREHTDRVHSELLKLSSGTASGLSAEVNRIHERVNSLANATRSERGSYHEGTGALEKLVE